LAHGSRGDVREEDVREDDVREEDVRKEDVREEDVRALHAIEVVVPEREGEMVPIRR
jgi:hypothetical protein